MDHALKLTRLVHACISVERRSTLLFIDPGEFGLPENLNTADAVLVTHDHFDHVSHTALRELLEAKPAVKIYGPKSFADHVDFHVTVVKNGDRFEVGDISVEVIGEWQDVANLNDPPIENVGYLIGGKILHPGDAYPYGIHPEVALVPLAAPWSKGIDMQKWLLDARPKRVIAYHDVILNDLGKEFGEKTLSLMAKEIGAEALSLKPGESIML